MMADADEYPIWICHACGLAHGRGFPGRSSTYHIGDACGWCGRDTEPVTEPRDYGYPPAPKEEAAMADPRIEILLNRRGGPRWEPLTRENTTCDGWAWTPELWGGLDWPATAQFFAKSIFGRDPHIRVHFPGLDTYHRVRGKRCTILGMRKVGEGEPT